MRVSISRPRRAASAHDGIVGIGDLLQLDEDEARDNQHAFDEAGFDQIGNAAVNKTLVSRTRRLSGLVWGAKRT